MFVKHVKHMPFHNGPCVPIGHLFLRVFFSSQIVSHNSYSEFKSRKIVSLGIPLNDVHCDHTAH